MAIGIGETLRAARRDQALSLSDISEATRIRQSYLVALEDDDFEALGDDVYVRGFLRNYARHLDLDPEPLLAEYRARFQPEQQDTPVATVPAVRERAPLPRPVRAVAATGALVLLLAVVAVLGDRGTGGLDDPGPPARPTLAATPPQDPTPGGNGTATPAPVTTPALPPTTEPVATQPRGVEVRLQVQGGACWVRVVVDGVTEVEATLDDGDDLHFNGEESVVLRLGDAGRVLLTVDGSPAARAGPPGAVVDLEFTAEG